MYEEMRCYVRDMLACLDVKGPDIEECQNQLHRAWLDNANRLAARAKQDLLDQFDVAYDGPPRQFDAHGRDMTQQLFAALEHRIADRKVDNKQQQVDVTYIYI